MDLRGLRNSYPHSLSGGQRQRVSLARAMVRKPKILMLDEPLASLDSVNRTRLQDYLLELKSKHAMTIILVSHDSNEIIKMCDELIYIEQGMVSSKNTKYHFMTELPITGALVIDDLIEDSGKFICVLKWEQSKYKMELSPDQFAEFRIGDEITLRDLH